MKKENFKLKSDADGLELDVTMFIPNHIKGIVQLSHGMVECKEYYYDFMEYLTKNGYVTIINDHRGHGHSVKNEEDLGYFYDETSDYIVEDLHQITKYVKDKYPNYKLILFGHSMGSLVVRKYIKKYDYEIDKLIVCGSPSNNKLVGLGLFLTKAFKKIKGDKYRSNFINRLSGLPDKDKSWLSTDEEYVNNYINDKYCSYIFTTNGFINLTKLLMSVYSKKGWVLKNKELPIFFIAGEDDIVIRNKKMWMKSIEFLKSLGYKNIIYKLYPGMRHAIVLEKNKKLVYEDIIKFI